MTSETKHHRPFALKKPRSLRPKQPPIAEILVPTEDLKPDCQQNIEDSQLLQNEDSQPQQNVKDCQPLQNGKDCQPQQNVKDCLPQQNVEDSEAKKNVEDNLEQQNIEDIKRVVLFTLQTKDGDEMILTGWNAKSVWNAADRLRQSGEIEIVTLEIFSDKNEDGDTENGQCSENGMLKKSSEKGVRYTKEDLIKLSQSESCKAPPPLWKLLSHTHSPCCLPAEQIKSYFEPSRFQHHDGTYVVNKYFDTR